MAEVQSFLPCVHQLAMRQHILFLQCQYHCRHVAPCLMTDCGKELSLVHHIYALSPAVRTIPKEQIFNQCCAGRWRACGTTAGSAGGSTAVPVAAGSFCCRPSSGRHRPSASASTAPRPHATAALPRRCAHVPAHAACFWSLDCKQDRRIRLTKPPLDGIYHTNQDTQILFCYFIAFMFHSVGRIRGKRAQGLICNSSSTPDLSQPKSKARPTRLNELTAVGTTCHKVFEPCLVQFFDNSRQ